MVIGRRPAAPTQNGWSQLDTGRRLRARQENLRHRESERGLSRQLRVAASFNHKSHLLEIPYDSVSSEIALTPPPLPHGMSDRSQPSAILRSRWKLGNRHGKRHIITFLPRREGSVRPLCRAIPVCMPVATKGLAGGRHRQGAVPVTPAVRETPVSHHNGD